jgi:hypothetical protein
MRVLYSLDLNKKPARVSGDPDPSNPKIQTPSPDLFPKPHEQDYKNSTIQKRQNSLFHGEGTF